MEAKNILLNHQRVTEEIKEEIKNTRRQYESKNMMIQNIYNVAKAILLGKFIALQGYQRKKEKKSQTT